jgi:D-alanine-D-alanine ligase
MRAKNKIRVAVLRGGPSPEHDVSLRTGAMVFKHLNRTRYAPKLITISKRGAWPVSFAELNEKFDIVFNALHGTYGEDGELQKVLDEYGIPYTGSGERASRVGMDKVASMQVFKKAGIRVPKYVVVSKNSVPRVQVPIVVKPANCGSSVGVSIVREKKDLPRAIARALTYAPRVIVQKFIAGTEVTCGVIEKNGKLFALPPTEIVPVGSVFFDYRAKYVKGGSDEITPARISQHAAKRVQRLAIKAHRAIGATGYSRTDVILENNSPYILEINTLPGLTAGSLLPKAAAAARIPFAKLLDIIIESAPKRR